MPLIFLPCCTDCRNHSSNRFAMTSSVHRLSSNPGVSTKVKLVPAYLNSYGVTYSVAEWRYDELPHLRMGLVAKPEDNLCPTTMSFLPETALMNELFPAPVIPINAMTTSDEVEPIFAGYALATTRRSGRLTTFGGFVFLFYFEDRGIL